MNISAEKLFGIGEVTREQARKIGVEHGVLAFAVLQTPEVLDFTTYNVIVNNSVRLPQPETRGEHDKGTNYLIVAGAKLGEMIHHLRDSGRTDEALLLRGEMGFKGGIYYHYGLHYFVAYSGGTPEEDLVIAGAAIRILAPSFPK